MNLDETQIKAVNAPENKIVVLASAGSGKTRVLTERVRKILNSGIDQKKVVAITFTNMAADEMRARLGDVCNDMFIGTIHSYANKLLVQNGFDTKEILADGDRFDELFDIIKEYPHVIEPVEYLLVDEFQDVTKPQFDFFMSINAENFFVVGDDWQSIYSFNNADVNLFKKLVKDKEYTVYLLPNNYRNPYPILSFAQKQIMPLRSKIDKTVKCKGPKEGECIQGEWTYYQMANFLRENGDYKNWFILCRTNKQIQDIIHILKSLNIPCETFKKNGLTQEILREKLEADTVKVLTIHASKGLEADNVIVWQFRYWIKDEERRLAYVAATRARKRLFWLKKKEGFY